MYLYIYVLKFEIDKVIDFDIYVGIDADTNIDIDTVWERETERDQPMYRSSREKETDHEKHVPTSLCVENAC